MKHNYFLQALNDDGTLSINDPFAEALGEEYITLAYETARKADPHVKLYIVSRFD